MLVPSGTVTARPSMVAVTVRTAVLGSSTAVITDLRRGRAYVAYNIRRTVRRRGGVPGDRLRAPVLPHRAHGQRNNCQPSSATAQRSELPCGPTPAPAGWSAGGPAACRRPRWRLRAG